MRLRAWRITKSKHANTAFTGEGAEKGGGRWNSPGTRLVYAASSVSLALVEMLVHFGSEPPLESYLLYSVAFDSRDANVLTPADLAAGWDSFPPTSISQSIGDEWAQQQTSLVLQVPSAVVPMESNFLFNPAHSRFDKIEIGDPMPFPIDPRLVSG